MHEFVNALIANSNPAYGIHMEPNDSVLFINQHLHDNKENDQFTRKREDNNNNKKRTNRQRTTLRAS